MNKEKAYKSFNSFLYRILNYKDISNSTTNDDDKPMKRYFIYYILLYIWMIRMAMSVIGLFGPISYSIYRKITPTDVEPIINSIDTIKWFDYLSNVNTYINLGIPCIVSNVPVLSSTNILYLLKESNTNIIYASNHTMFTAFYDNTWADLYNITPSFMNINRNDNDTPLSSLSCQYSYDHYPEPFDDPLFQAVANSLVKVLTSYTDSYKNHDVKTTADIYQSYCPNITFTPRYQHHHYYH